MKLLLSLIFLFYSIQSDNTLELIGSSIEAGSAKELIKFCNATVELKMDGESSNYSKAQAEVILKNFFQKYPPSSFQYIHSGSSPEGLKYTIGHYTHSGGKYRIVMLIKKIGSEYLIDTINFSQE